MLNKIYVSVRDLSQTRRNQTKKCLEVLRSFAAYRCYIMGRPAGVLYLSVLYCSVLYCSVLYCSVLYCGVLYYLAGRQCFLIISILYVTHNSII